MYPFRYILLFFLLLPFILHAQDEPTYNMSNLVVDDCAGVLLDSDNGDIGGTYDHNEDLTFSICVDGATEIILSFSAFCTEEEFDYMLFFDGPDTLSTQIGGVYTGEIDPPDIVATSGCLTVYFHSDANVTCTGWVAEWEVDVDVPEAPAILPISNVACESSSVIVEFDEPIACEDFTIDAFTLTGPLLPTITNVTPLNCTNGTATIVQLDLDPFLDVSGTYDIQFINTIEICGVTYYLESTGSFAVTDCPLFLDLTIEDDPICAGACTNLVAEVSGGDASSYSYNWFPTAPNQDSILVCIADTTTYSVTVTDGAGSTITGAILIEPAPIPSILNGDLTICKSIDTLEFNATPIGGTWSGLGILDENAGTYSSEELEVNRDTVIYTTGAGCLDSIFVTILPLDEGTDDASCPNASPFLVSGGLPVGGSWSGPFITPDGLFTPDSVGSFEVTYTHPNGCSDSKLVNVDSIQLPQIDSICQSEPAFEIGITPFGGIYTGVGIIDENTGEFDPAEANQGDNWVYYAIHGCTDSINIHIKEINATGDLSACPDETPFILPGSWGPIGGSWSGIGITDSLTGMYDPSILGAGNDTLTYTFQGCTDQRIVYIRYTNIPIEDTLQFCLEDDWFALNRDNTGQIPNNGAWSGNGVVNPQDNDYFFVPVQAGVGIHTLIYTRNDCIDSLKIEVLPIPMLEIEDICIRTAPIALEASLGGGDWSGNGIINSELGIFSPEDAGVGTHKLEYIAGNGCSAIGTIEVIEFNEAIITGIEDDYCFKDTLINIEIMPLGGTLTINGQAATTFNPAEYGTGPHLIKYTVGEDECQDTEKITVDVGYPIQVILPYNSDTLCAEQSFTIEADAEGGTGNFDYTWDGVGTGSQQYLSPSTTTTYEVMVEDGCSDPAIAEFTAFVNPPILMTYETGDAVCYEDTTFATINMLTEGDYSVAWNSTPIQYGFTLFSHPRSYTVTITDALTGCSIEEDVVLPGANLLNAKFDVTPKEGCIDLIDPTIQLIDYSVNGSTGYWDFGDGSIVQIYEFGQTINYTYADTGNYVVTLHLEQDGCIDEHQLNVCVQPAERLYAPNAFTPNYDGQNDEFLFKGFGIEQIEWHIFDRWGKSIFQASDMNTTWDGTYRGQRVDPGVYVFVATYFSPVERREKVMKGMVSVIY